MIRHKRGSRFLRIDERIYQSPAFRTLPAAAMKLWILLRMDFTPSKNGRIMATLATLRPKGWHSSDLLRRMLPVLVERGLLAFTSKAGPNVYRHASLLRFTDEPVLPAERENAEPTRPTDDFLRWLPSHAGDVRADDAAPKRKFAQSGPRTKVSPRSGLTQRRGPDYGGQETVRGPDYGKSNLTSRRESENEQNVAERVRSPRSGHTLESASAERPVESTAAAYPPDSPGASKVLAFGAAEKRPERNEFARSKAAYLRKHGPKVKP